MKSIRYRANGFTLIEMLVAVSLLGLLGIISWRGLDQVMTQRERVNDQTIDIERVVRTIGQIERDVDQRVADVLMVAPPIVLALPYSMSVVIDSEGRHRVSILRGLPEAHGAQTVAYYVHKKELVRTVLVEGTTAASTTTMLEEVEEFTTRLLLARGWVRADSLEATQSERARAIEFVIERHNGERYERVLPL